MLVFKTSIQACSLSVIAVIAVAPTGKASFVYSYVQTRLKGQYNGKWPFSLVYVLQPLITPIRAISAQENRANKLKYTHAQESEAPKIRPPGFKRAFCPLVSRAEITDCWQSRQCVALIEKIPQSVNIEFLVSCLDQSPLLTVTSRTI